MEKAEVLRLFLGKGYQIDVESLTFFAKNENSLQKFISEMDKQTFPSTITKDFVDSVLQSDVEISGFGFDKKTITAEEIARTLFNKFNIIKKILLTHLDLVNLVSINKINQKMKKLSLIGIVTSIDESAKTVTIADDTGEITLHLEKTFFNEILVNDVLGFICEQNDTIVVRNIVFPDVPLQRKAKSFESEKFVVFAEKTSNELIKWCSSQKNPVYLFSFSQQNSFEEIPSSLKIIFVGDGPSIASISNYFSVLLFNGAFLQDMIGDKKVDEFLISLFKKRYFNATRTINKNLLNNAYLIENVPDMIVIKGLAEAIQTNYKGTTLLTITENVSWIINLKTREIIKLSSA